MVKSSPYIAVYTLGEKPPLMGMSLTMCIWQWSWCHAWNGISVASYDTHTHTYGAHSFHAPMSTFCCWCSVRFILGMGDRVYVGGWNSECMCACVYVCLEGVCVYVCVCVYLGGCSHMCVFAYMEHHEPKSWMLFRLGNITYLVDVTPSNSLPHPLSLSPCVIQVQKFGC